MQSTTNQKPRIEKGFGVLANLFAILGSIALIGLMMVTVVSVFWRYVLRNPIFGIEDVSAMSLTVIVAASVAFGAIHMSHVAVNIISGVAGRKVTRVTDILARGAGIFITGYAAYGLFVKGACGLPCGAITSNLSILHGPFYYILGVAMALYSAHLLYHLVVGLQHWSTQDPNEMDA